MQPQHPEGSERAGVSHQLHRGIEAPLPGETAPVHGWGVCVVLGILRYNGKTFNNEDTMVPCRQGPITTTSWRLLLTGPVHLYP